MTKPILSVLLLGLVVTATGCVTEPVNIPSDAGIVSEGNKLVQYQAPHAGQVYVYNVTDKAVVYSGEIDEGDVLVVDPQADRITIDNAVALEKKLDRGDQYRIHFKRTGTVEREVHIQETRTEKVTDR